MGTYDIIVRVSNVGQRTAEMGYMSPDDQARYCSQVITGFKAGRVGRTFDAQDISGWISVDSPVYRQALDRVKRGETSGFAFAYSTRIGRNVRAVGRYLEECEAAGADIIFADKPTMDYRTKEGRQSTTLDGLMGEGKYLEDKDRGERIADAVVARGVPNRVPFGYKRNGTFIDGALASKVDPDRDPKALVPDPETAPLLVRIFEMRRDGYSWTSIGQWLEAEEVKPPRGGSWAVSTLRNIIANEMYRGVIQLGERRMEDAHEPLVSRSLWNAAQSSRTLQRTGKNAAGIAGGLLVCRHCGRRLSVTGTQNPSYTCRRQLGGKCPHPVYVSKKHADAFVERSVRDALRGEGVYGALAVSRLSDSREIGEWREDLADAKAELEEYVVTAKALDADLFKRGLDARQKKVREATEYLDEMLSKTEEAAELPHASDWDALDLDGRRKVARTLIDFVVVDDAEEAARIAAEIYDVERLPSRGRGAKVDMRFDIFWRNDYEHENYPPGLSSR